MSAIDDLPPLREVIRQHALSARKSLGQNFLLDLNLTARIARAAGPLEDATIIEIGPGPGGLTRALLALGARRVIAVERDQRALAALEYYLRRRAVFRPTAAARRRQSENRRQPALQYRDRAVDRLAVDRAVAALVRHDGADVPARSGRANCRPRE
jgi:threonine dehydrogenase-like Zn-dependent dehydrogenase